MASDSTLPPTVVACSLAMLMMPGTEATVTVVLTPVSVAVPVALIELVAVAVYVIVPSARPLTSMAVAVQSVPSMVA